MGESGPGASASPFVGVSVSWSFGLIGLSPVVVVGSGALKGP